MKLFPLVFLAGVSGAAILAASGVATASTTAASSATGSSASAGTDGHAAHGRTSHRLLTPHQRRTLRRTGHVEFVKHTRKHGDVTLEVQRGDINSVSGTAITLTSKDGYPHTYVVTPKTKVRENGQTESVSALRDGERVMVVAVHEPNGDVARRISCVRTAAAVRPDAPTAVSS